MVITEIPLDEEDLRPLQLSFHGEKINIYNFVPDSSLVEKYDGPFSTKTRLKPLVYVLIMLRLKNFYNTWNIEFIESANKQNIWENVFKANAISWQIFELKFLNPFVPKAPFRHPLETSENRKIFWCFQGVDKGSIGKKRVNPFQTTAPFLFALKISEN